MKKFLLILTIFTISLKIVYAIDNWEISNLREAKICFQNDNNLEKFLNMKILNKKAKINVCYPYFIVEDEKSSIKKRIKFLNKYIENNVKKLLISVVKDINETGNSFFTPEYNLSYKVGLINKGIFSGYLYENSYFGGAHYIDTYYFINLDLKNKKLIKFKDVFKEEDLPLIKKFLLKIGKNEVIDKYSIKEFLTDKKPLNFYLTKDYIIFAFQPYEYAPYTMGYREIKVEPIFLKVFMNENSIIYKYYFEK